MIQMVKKTKPTKNNTLTIEPKSLKLFVKCGKKFVEYGRCIRCPYNSLNPNGGDIGESVTQCSFNHEL